MFIYIMNKSRKKNKIKKNKIKKNRSCKFLRGGTNTSMREKALRAAEQRIKNEAPLKELFKLAKNSKEELNIEKIYALLLENKNAKKSPELFTEETNEVLNLLANRELKHDPPKIISRGSMCVVVPKRLKLDESTKCWNSIEPYLADIESRGSDEVLCGSFYDYRFNIGNFLTILLYENKYGLLSDIACVPSFYLCVYRKPKINEYKIVTKEDLTECHPSNTNLSLLYGDQSTSFGRIILWNTPRRSEWASLEGNNKSVLFYPDNLPKMINRCKNLKKDIVIFELILIGKPWWKYGSHANVIIFNLTNKTIERFDPHGGSEYKDSVGLKKTKAYYNQLNIDLILYETFIMNKKLFPDYTYISASRICLSNIGPQVHMDHFEGLCVTWSTMYILLRILNPTMQQDEITKIMVSESREKTSSILLKFNRYIADKLRGYSEEQLNEIKIENFDKQKAAFSSRSRSSKRSSSRRNKRSDRTSLSKSSQ